MTEPAWESLGQSPRGRVADGLARMDELIRAGVSVRERHSAGVSFCFSRYRYWTWDSRALVLPGTCALLGEGEGPYRFTVYYTGGYAPWWVSLSGPCYHRPEDVLEDVVGQARAAAAVRRLGAPVEGRGSGLRVLGGWLDEE